METPKSNGKIGQSRGRAKGKIEVRLHNFTFFGGHAQLDASRKSGEKHGYTRGIDNQEFNMVSDYHTLSNYNQLKYFLEVAHSMEEIRPNF